MDSIWEPKSTTIQKAHYMKILTFDELLRALRVHEVHFQRKEKFPRKDFLALKTKETSSRKTEGIEKHLKAFKA
ncbi:hypothetical protein CR513_37608, partial [Mucuna pruriens]